jgi:hypothetical protein
MQDLFLQEALETVIIKGDSAVFIELKEKPTC